MLTAIRIGNFKAFAERQRILVCPLILIYGANSSGKSSVLHSLVLAHHTLGTGDGQMRSPYISLSGNVRHGKEYSGGILFHTGTGTMIYVTCLGRSGHN